MYNQDLLKNNTMTTRKKGGLTWQKNVHFLHAYKTLKSFMAKTLDLFNMTICTSNLLTWWVSNAAVMVSMKQSSITTIKLILELMHIILGPWLSRFLCPSPLIINLTSRPTYNHPKHIPTCSIIISFILSKSIILLHSRIETFINIHIIILKLLLN